MNNSENLTKVYSLALNHNLDPPQFFLAIKIARNIRKRNYLSTDTFGRRVNKTVDLFTYSSFKIVLATHLRKLCDLIIEERDIAHQQSSSTSLSHY